MLDVNGNNTESSHYNIQHQELMKARHKNNYHHKLSKRRNAKKKSISSKMKVCEMQLRGCSRAAYRQVPSRKPGGYYKDHWVCDNCAQQFGKKSDQLIYTVPFKNL